MSKDAPVLDAAFHDVDALCATVRSWDLDFRPLRVRGEPTQVARIVQQHCDGLELAYARFHLSIEQLGAPPEGMVTFAVLGEQMRRLWWRGHDVDAGTVLVFLPGAELHSVSGPDFEVTTVSLPVESVRRISDQWRLPPAALERRIEIFRPAAVGLAALRERLRQLRDRNASSRNGMGRLRDVRMVGEGLVLDWLRACLSNEAGQMVRASGRARDRAMRTSLALIEQADLSQLTPAALCETCGVGERTLQYAFRERFGLTPAAFLKARRLALVRSALQQFEAKQAGIGDLAARYGFWHPGQFASDYRRAFSETPSETLRRAIQRV